MKSAFMLPVGVALALLASSCAVLTRENRPDPTYTLEPVLSDKIDIQSLAFPAPSAFRMPQIVGEPWFLVCRSGLLEAIVRTGARLEIAWPGQDSTNYFSVIHVNPPGPWVESVSPAVFTSQQTVYIRLTGLRAVDQERVSVQSASNPR